MDIIIKKFRGLCNTASDINAHLPTLFRYAKQCNSAIELGVRRCISSWAISAGLLENKNGVRKRMFMNDSRDWRIRGRGRRFELGCQIRVENRPGTAVPGPTKPLILFSLTRGMFTGKFAENWKNSLRFAINILLCTTPL